MCIRGLNVGEDDTGGVGEGMLVAQLKLELRIRCRGYLR